MSDNRILLALRPEPERAVAFRTGLERLGHQIAAEVADVVSAVQATRTLLPDVVVLDLGLPLCTRDALAAALALARDGTAPLVVLAASDGRDDELLRAAIAAGAMAYLPGPCSVTALAPQIEIAVARWRETQKLRRHLEKTRKALQERGKVERAKHLLMELKGLTEAEAYRWLQKASMNTRKPIWEIAEAVLLAAEAQNPDGPEEQTG